jgi:hypothetical protein
MSRLQKLLSGLLALQVVLAVVVFWPRTPAGVESGPLFGELDTEDIVALTLDDGEGTLTELVRQGSSWVLGGAGDYPADSGKIEPILSKIAAIQTNRLVARSSGSHKRLQVADDDFAQRIQLEMVDGSTQILLVGTAPNPSGTHIRRGDQDETYLTGDLAAWEINPAVSNWIDTAYTSLNRSDIVSYVLENGNGTFAFEKISEEEWTLKDLAGDEEIEQSAFNTLLSRITNMRMTEPLGSDEEPDFQLSDPQAAVTVIVEDSEAQSTKVYTLLVGAQDPDDDNYFVKWSDSDFYVKVASFNVQEMVSQVRDDFILAQPATPTPTPEPEGDTGEETATPTPDT